jgi:hypothetical protein
MLIIPDRLAVTCHGTPERRKWLEVDHERVRLWMFVRAAAEPRDVWNDDAIAVARALA